MEKFSILTESLQTRISKLETSSQGAASTYLQSQKIKIDQNFKQKNVFLVFFRLFHSNANLYLVFIWFNILSSIQPFPSTFCLFCHIKFKPIKSCYKNYQWLDSKPRSLVSGATAKPTVPQRVIQHWCFYASEEK